MPGHSMLWTGTNKTYLECTRLQIWRSRHASESKLTCPKEAMHGIICIFLRLATAQGPALAMFTCKHPLPSNLLPTAQGLSQPGGRIPVLLEGLQGSSSLVLRVGCLLRRHLLVLRLPLGQPLSLRGALLVLLGRSAASWRLLILLRRRAASWRLLVLLRRGPTGWRLLELLRRRAALRHLVLRLLPCTWEL